MRKGRQLNLLYRLLKLTFIKQGEEEDLKARTPEWKSSLMDSIRDTYHKKKTLWSKSDLLLDRLQFRVVWGTVGLATLMIACMLLMQSVSPNRTDRSSSRSTLAEVEYCQVMLFCMGEKR